MYHPAFACLSMLANSHKTTDHIFMTILPEMCLWTKKNWLAFAVFLAFESGSSNLKKIKFQHCETIILPQFRSYL